MHVNNYRVSGVYRVKNDPVHWQYFYNRRDFLSVMF